MLKQIPVLIERIFSESLKFLRFAALFSVWRIEIFDVQLDPPAKLRWRGLNWTFQDLFWNIIYENLQMEVQIMDKLV